jgi:2'-5' RNA ligase
VSLLGIRAQRAIFFMLRRWEAWHLSRGDLTIWEPLPRAATIATSVVRVPERLGQRLRDTVLPALNEHKPHYAYPAGDLHVTIANLDQYRDVPPGRIAEVLTDCLHKAGPISLDLRGLAVSRAAVFTPVHATPASSLLRLRAAMHRALSPGRLRVAGNPAAAIGFCNVLRFRHDDLSAVRALAENNSCTDFGSFQIDEIEVVATDKVLSAAGTVVLAKVIRRS